MVATPSAPNAIFLDGSSGEPLLPEAREAWNAAHDAGWGDPLRLHRPGRLAARALDTARDIVARTVAARADEVVFTGSATGAVHAAVAGLAHGRRRIGSGIVVSTVEHSSVLAAADAYGHRVDVAVDRFGRLDLDAWSRAVRAPGIALAALQVANQEVGTLQPYAEAAAVCQAAGIPMLLDATPALGRMTVDPGWSVLVGGAAAYGGPASVGLLVIRRGTRWQPPYPTDDYQDGRWPGLPDVPSVVAAAVALEQWNTDRDAIGAQQFALVDRLRRGVAAAVTDVDLVGDPVDRLPHLLTFSTLYVDGETLVTELDRIGIAVASGSACSATSETPSHVLAAMGALTHGNLRIGLTRTTTEAEVDSLVAALPPIVAEIRSRLGAP